MPCYELSIAIVALTEDWFETTGVGFSHGKQLCLVLSQVTCL